MDTRVICWSCYQCASAKRSSQASNGGNSSIGARGTSTQTSSESRGRYSMDNTVGSESENGFGSKNQNRSSSGFDEMSYLERKLSSVEMEVTTSSQQNLCDKEEVKSASCLEDVFSEVELPPELLSSNDCYWSDDCLSHIYQILSYHPKYLDIFLAFHSYVLHGQCPLPREYRHYLAIMAASRHNCSFLVKAETEEFLSVGGPKEWLTSLDNAPSILRNLKEINKLMAHRPWLLTSDHIKKVMSGGDKWSLSSLGHAIIILAHFHALSSFVLASGVTIVNEDEAIESSSSGSEGDSLSVSSEIEVNSIIMRMNKLQEAGGQMGIMSPDQLLQNYETIESESCQLPLHERKKPQQETSCFNDDNDYRYEDFANRPNHDSISALQARDYSWQDHGFCFSNLLVTEVGDFLDKRFNMAQKLTYNNMGNIQGVDTSKFRQAIWNIVQCLFGLRHDDYNYMIIDILLDKKSKTFIKMAACHPERVNCRLYNLFAKELKPSEKIQINIIIMEARLQAEILYAMRAISQYRSYGL